MTTPDIIETAAAVICGAMFITILALFAVRLLRFGRTAAEDNARIYESEYQRPKKDGK